MPSRLRNSTKPGSHTANCPKDIRHTQTCVCFAASVSRSYETIATLTRISEERIVQLSRLGFCNMRIYRTACLVTRRKSRDFVRRKLVVYSGRSVCWEFDVLSKGTESSGTCSCIGARKCLEKPRKKVPRVSSDSYVLLLFRRLDDIPDESDKISALFTSPITLI